MLELRRLRYMVVLARRLSYSRAAEDLGLSQSALSRSIQSLEQELGVRLFDRDRAGVLLTEQGRWIVEKAESLLVSATDFEHQVSFAARGAEGRTRFGLAAVPASALLPALATRIQNMPNFSHEVSVAEVEALWLQLAVGEIEFMVCSEWHSAWPIPEGMPVRKESLGHFPVSLVGRSGHPVFTDPSYTFESGGYPLLISNAVGVSSETTLAVRKRFGSSVQIIGDIASARVLVRDTNAIWLTSSFVVSSDIAEGTLLELELPSEVQERSFEIFIYSLSRRTKSQATIQIEDLFRRAIREIACKLSSK